METLRAWLHIFLLVLVFALCKDGHASGGFVAKPLVSTEVRSTARKLAHEWVSTASAQTLDQLANRSIAFAGMVPGLFVVLDGSRMNASQALVDSGLTIIKSNVNEQDAAAIRNTVYILMEIAEGRVKR